MQLLQNEHKCRLPIVSSGLLRVTTNEWCAPEEQFRRLRDHALNMMLDATAGGSLGFQANMKRAILLFDCLLRVIDEPSLSSSIAFATTRFRELQILFYGALGSDRFIDASEATRIAWAYGFYTVLKRLDSKTPVMLPGHRQKAAGAIPEEFVHVFEQLNFDDEQVRKLRPYLLQTKSGVEYNVLLGDMVSILGERFTNEFHEGLRTIARPKAKDTALRDFGTTFTRFVCHRASNHQPVSPKLLMEPAFVQTLLVDFMEYHFMKMTRRKDVVQEGTLGSLQKLWSRYQHYWNALVRQKILAPPSSAFPAGNPKLLSDDSIGHRKVKIDETGNTTVISQKLITAVPLHLTDEEATKLIFEQLKTDFIKVQTWLRNHLDSFFSDYELGHALATEVQDLPGADKLEQATSAIAGDFGFPVAIKYFKDVHGGYTDTSRIPTTVYPNLAARSRISKERLARYLGIPGRQEAMAFMAFLASHDGRFSESALATAKLFDGTGKPINAVETDAGLTLTVLKERDAGDGWHDVLLAEEVASIVRRWIDVTAPIRKHMKDHGVSGWQNLIIYTGNPLGAPAHFVRSSNINSTFRNFALAHETQLGSLAAHVTIPRIRSTRGVLVFLETMDISQMARELGNTNETSLRHYLPDSLWEYFTTRWLRIFQNLLIVEATKDTPYMQRALNFRNAAEMDEFLKNHAVTPLIPKEEEASEQVAVTSTERAPSELMVAASPGIFAILFSIAEASFQATALGRQLTPQALYWTEFTKRLKAHVQSAAFHDRGIKQMMDAAAANATPINFMEVVCA